MSAKRLSWSIALVAAAAIVGGCGSAASSTSTSPATTPASTAASPRTTSSAPAASAIAPRSTTPAPTPTATTTTAGASAAASPLANCLKAVNSEHALTAKQISQLDQVCQAVRGGDQAKVRAQSEQTCRNFVNSSSLPGPAKARALTACRQP